MRNDINFKHLHYFWAVAKEGSIAAASHKLHITPQTISGQLSLLEKQMGSSLFEKQGRGLVLSETGRLVLRYADEIFELGSELSEVLRGSPTNVGTAEFVVSATSTLPKTIVYKIVAPALQLDQQVNLICKEGPAETILAELAVHKTDMVLSDTPLSGNLNIKAYNHFLGESHLTVFASEELAANYRKDFPNCLDRAPMLLPTSQYAIRRDIDTWLQDREIYPLIRGQFDDSALIKAFGQSGMGLFFIPSVIAPEVESSYSVKPIGVIEEVTQKFYAISAERKVRHPAVAAICDNARRSIFDEVS